MYKRQTVIRTGSQIFRFLTAVPKGSPSLDSIANVLRSSFRKMSPEEAAGLKPLRIRVVTVQPGENMGTLANRMMGTNRKLELFQLINALNPTSVLTPGSKVKLITE